MKQHTIDYVKQVRKLLVDTVSTLNDIRDGIKNCTDLKELADYAHALNEVSQMLVGMDKTVRQHKTLAEQIACLLWVNTCPDGEPHNIKTEYVTATPKVTMIASIPKRSTPEYEKLMSFLGVPFNLVGNDEETEVVRCHWPGLVSMLSRMLEEGHPLPPGIDPNKTYPVYSLGLRRRKSADE